MSYANSKVTPASNVRRYRRPRKRAAEDPKTPRNAALKGRKQQKSTPGGIRNVADSCLASRNRLLGKLSEIAFDDDRSDQIKAIDLLLKRFDNEDLDEDSYEIKHIFGFPHNGRDEPFE